MNREETIQAFSRAAREGWNPGLNDATSLYQFNPNALVCLQNNDTVAGYGSLICYDSNYGFCGLFLLVEEFRNQGLRQLIRHRLHDGSRPQTIGIDSHPDHTHLYKRLGFRSHYRHLRYRVKQSFCRSTAEPEDNEAVDGNATESIQVIPLQNVPGFRLHAFDRLFFPASRGTFLQIWCQQPDTTALAALRYDDLLGYILVRPCFEGSKVGPLHALSPRVAEKLLNRAIHTLKRWPLYMDVPEPNCQAMKIAQRFGMQIVSKTTRMYTSPPRPTDLSGVFAVTSLETG